MNDLVTPTQLEDPLARFLETLSVEVVSNDKTLIDLAGALLRPGAEVFIANLPKHKAEKQIDAAIALRKSGLVPVPVPHIVARNVLGKPELAALLRGLTRHAVVDTALVLFDPKPIIAWIKALRAAQVHVPYRIGVAGPASKSAPIKFALLSIEESATTV